MSKIKTYQELITLPTFEERYRYLKLNGKVGESTFGFERYLNQTFYRSDRWKKIRNEVIIRDNACDLGIDGYQINDKIYIHHMNPIDSKDIMDETEYLLDPNYLICCRFSTHNAIHYGDESLLPIYGYVERKPNDTCLWK